VTSKLKLSVIWVTDQKYRWYWLSRNSCLLHWKYYSFSKI